MKVVVTKFAEDPWGIVFEFEIVSGGWSQFVSDTVMSVIISFED